ncbi:uncharacterized protein TNCV_1394271 [Trichonephila clavipes]|nr:uncharacterized protein TNCV_1394271 [Trichonephila clavipes]
MVAKLGANLALPPRFRQILIEPPLYKELLVLLPLSGQTREENIANAVQKCLEDNKFDLNNVSTVIKKIKDEFADKSEQFKTNKTSQAFIGNLLNTIVTKFKLNSQIESEIQFGIDTGSLEMQLIELKSKALWSGKFSEL